MQDEEAKDNRIQPPPRRVPAINLPPLTGSLILLAVLVHLVRAWFPDSNHIIYPVLVFIPLPFVSDMQVTLLDWTGLFGHWLLHASLMHLVMNMVMLAVFGRLLEIHWGRWPLLLVFLVSVATGAMFEGLFGGNPEARLVGASGGAMGFIGALIGLSLAVPPHVRAQVGGLSRLAWALLAFNVLLPATGIFELGGLMVSWLSHLGGAIAGAAAGYVMERRQSRRRYDPY